jgi:hypothetical protein
METTLELLWKRYRTWEVTSQRLKASSESWKRRVMYLTLAGTALGALAPFAGGVAGGPWPGRLMGLAGTVCLALATYFAKELLDTKHEQRWTRARTAAEAYKGEAHKYHMQSGPYAGPDRDSHVLARLPELEAITPGQVPDTLPDAEARAGIPASAWSLDDYVTKRLGDQVAWFRTRAADHVRSMTRGRVATLVLGGVAVVLSAVTATITGGEAQQGTVAAALLGVVTTAAGAIGAYFQASHYEATALRYTETANALERRRLAGTADVNALVSDIEAILQAENAAWLTERTAATV